MARSSSLSSSSSLSGKRYGIVFAMLVWKVGEKAWRFAVPLLLLDVAANVSGGAGEASHATLGMPAAYGMLTSVASALFGPALGAAVDARRRRAGAVGAAAVITGVAVLVGAFVMCSVPTIVVNIAGDAEQKRKIILWLVVCGAAVVGAIESLASMVAMVALSRDWIPVLYEEEARMNSTRNRAGITTRTGSAESEPLLPPGSTDDTIDDTAGSSADDECAKLLAATNSAISTVNLLGETLAPLTAGVILAIQKSIPLPAWAGGGREGADVQVGSLVVACVGTISPLLAGAVLMHVHNTSTALQQPKKCVEKKGTKREEEDSTRTDEEDESVSSSTSTRTGFIGAWQTCIRHEYGIVIIVFAYSALYLSALSSHGILLTAFLKAKGASSTLLGAFRGAGAISGVLGVAVFPTVVGAMSLRRANTAYILLLVSGVTAATIAFLLGDQSATDVNGRVGTPLYVFMAMVVVSRAGLYGYEAGLMQHQQVLVDEKHRATVGGFEKALCNFATITLYGCGIIVGKPSRFAPLVLTGMCAVISSLVLYLTWIFLWPEVYHSHELEEDHTHTTQDEVTKVIGHSHPVKRGSAAAPASALSSDG